MADLEKIVEDLSTLTVMEAAELSKLLEEKWGVSAAAAVAVAPGGAAAGGAEAEETKATETTAKGTETFPGSKKLFEAPDTSQIGAKEDANINLRSKRAIEGGGFGSAATVINDLRDIIARISDSPSLSDDEKNSRIDIARSRAKERIEAMGLDSDNFNL